MIIGSHIEAPLSIICSFIAGVCSLGVTAWQAVVGIVTGENAIAHSVLYTAISVLFVSLCTIVAWVGTKFLEGQKFQSESNNRLAAAVESLSENFNGPLAEAFISHTYQQDRTLGSPPQPSRKRPHG